MGDYICYKCKNDYSDVELVIYHQDNGQCFMKECCIANKDFIKSYDISYDIDFNIYKPVGQLNDQDIKNKTNIYLNPCNLSLHKLLYLDTKLIKHIKFIEKDIYNVNEIIDKVVLSYDVTTNSLTDTKYCDLVLIILKLKKELNDLRI